MNKIINVLGEEQIVECMGCDIANHKLIPPGGYVYDDGFINVSADPEIPIEGFMILGIKTHTNTLNDLTEFERNEVMNVLNKTIESIKKAGIAKEVLVIQEERAMHIHIWIMPILKWMEKFNKSVKNIKEIFEYAKQNNTQENKDKILESIEKIRKEFKNSEKKIRNAAKCYLIKDEEVLVTKYGEDNIKAGYYDIPGGKIEEKETSEITAIRELKEETGITAKNLKLKGKLKVEYPDRIFIFDIFLSNEYEGEINTKENKTSEWIKIEELLRKPKILSNIAVLDRKFIKGLTDEKYNFDMYIKVDEDENIWKIDYELVMDK